MALKNALYAQSRGVSALITTRVGRNEVKRRISIVENPALRC
jgi:hypothetical protein